MAHDVLALDADIVRDVAARLRTAAEVLDEVLMESFSAHKETNLIFRDALILLLEHESRELEAKACEALKGKESTWTRTAGPAATRASA
jgi:hypothetical protein